jgi:hypothetical protein
VQFSLRVLPERRAQTKGHLSKGFDYLEPIAAFGAGPTAEAVSSGTTLEIPLVLVSIPENEEI